MGGGLLLDPIVLLHAAQCLTTEAKAIMVVLPWRSLAAVQELRSCFLRGADSGRAFALPAGTRGAASVPTGIHTKTAGHFQGAQF